MTTPKRTRWNIQTTANGWIVKPDEDTLIHSSGVQNIHSFNSLDAMMIWLRKSIKENVG
jgi:hypothetical protein